MDEDKNIKNREEYLKYFSNEMPNDGEKLDSNESKQMKALTYALDIRKFEIELYWKRATYFWAFIAASFAGYFVLVTKEKADSVSIIVVCVLGFLFSYSWYFVNRGSKFWQNNWERHVDYLEDEIIGPLYKTVKNPSNCNVFNPIMEYPFSVSKINQLLSLLITIIWIIIAYYNIHNLYTYLSTTMILTYEFAFIVAISLLYFYFGRSNLLKDKSIKDKCKFVIRELE